MKNTIAVLLCLSLLLTTTFVSCTSTDSTDFERNLCDADIINPSFLGTDDMYVIGGGDELYSFFEEPIESFYGVCKYYQENNYELYNYNVLNDNHFATWKKESQLAHIYYIECENELNLVTSSTGGKSLPPIQPEVISGDSKTSVTQVGTSEMNGMGYVIKLADGSFIVYDGGVVANAALLWNALRTLNGGNKGIVIRAWIITHSHADHYPCFSEFSSVYADWVTLETVMISPLSDSDAAMEDSYLNSGIIEDVEKFHGTKLLYVHTGMVFNYCNITLEILYTGDELWIAEPLMNEAPMDFNNSSIVSRIYTEDYSALFLGDSSEEVAVRMALYYGDYLKSNMCQMAHHGVEDFPLIVYRFIKPEILWYPCNQFLYDLQGRNDDVRKALKESKYTKEIILHDKGHETREFKTDKE